MGLNTNAKELELIHNIYSNQNYKFITKEGEKLTFYLDFYSPAIIDYNALKYFFVSGWYQFNESLDKYNLVGVFYPYDRVVLYVTDNKNLTRLDFQDNETLNLDTNFFLKRFILSLNNDKKKSIWFDGHKEKSIKKIDFEKNNDYHKIKIRGGNQDYYIDEPIDITDIVINPFGNNDILLEDYNIKIYSYDSDSSGNLHVLLYITNEYVIPSSLSSGGFYYIKFDKYQSIVSNNYIETYNQGKYISSIDESFIHPTKERLLIISDWSDSQVVGSFFIEHSKIKIESEW